MKSFVLNSLFFFCLFLMVSCGTPLKIDEYRPASIDPGANAAIAIRADDFFSQIIKEELKHYLSQDGYYSVFDDPHSRVDAVLCLNDAHNSVSDRSYIRVDKKNKDEKVKVWEYYASGGVTCHLVEQATGRVLTERKYSASSTDGSACSAEQSVAWKMARSIARDMIPRKDTYCIWISSVEENPLVEQAAKTCEIGDWSQGRKWALQAIRNNPRDAEAQFLMGAIERRNLRFSEASKYFSRAASLGNKSKYRAELNRCVNDRNNLKLYKEQISGGRPSIL